LANVLIIGPAYFGLSYLPSSGSSKLLIAYTIYNSNTRARVPNSLSFI